MKRSETFSAFAKAFATFQAEVSNPKLNKENPHLKNKYADLSEVLNTVRPILAKHGLSVHQDISSDENKVMCITTIFHESGEWLESSPFTLPFATGGKLAPAQVIGAATSYAKRYQLQAVMGVASEEDADGEELRDTQPQYVPQNLVGANGPTKDTLAAKYQLGTGSRDGFEEYYDKLINEGRDHKYIDAALNKSLEAKRNKPAS